MCGDECYWDDKCKSFEYCEEECHEGASSAPFEKRCELNYDTETTSSTSRGKNFVFCTPKSKS